MAFPARPLKIANTMAMAAHGERGAVAPLPDPAETEPNYFMTPTADARAAGSDEGFIGNPLEVA